MTQEASDVLDDPLILAAQTLADRLARCRRRVDLAESCTAGLAAAALGSVPGVSQWFCGSAVTYREATKTAWLDVDPGVIEVDTAVSGPVADRMAGGVLRATPEADLAAAIVGHLGPQAPVPLDGCIFLAIADRFGGSITIRQQGTRTLKTATRPARQREAAVELLSSTADWLSKEHRFA